MFIICWPFSLSLIFMPLTEPETVSCLMIISAQELEKDLHGPTADSIPAEKKLSVFDKIFTAYHEARSFIRSDLVCGSSAKSC